MNVAIEDLTPCQKKLTIQLSADEVNQEYQNVVQNLRKDVIIPGFRKGKASFSTIKRRFSRDIKKTVKENLLERSLKEALTDHEIVPVTTPSLDVKKITLAENRPLEYDVEVELIPPFELNYKGVQISKSPVTEVTEDHVQQTLTVLQQQNAVNEPVDESHVISNNSSVTLNYQRMLEGQPLEDRVKNFTCWLGVDQIPQELYNNLLGKQKGDHFTFSIHYGEDAQDKTLAGKTVDFTVDIVDVEKVVVPELDDEFAKDLEQDSLDALKEQIRNDLRGRFEADAVAATKNRLLMQLAETHPFEIPPSLLKQQKLQSPGKSEEELKKGLRAGIILSRIQQQEALTATEEEIEQVVQQLARQHQVSVAAMKGALTQQGGLNKIHSDLVEHKALDLLYEHAQIVEED
jgi:trigger factor